MPDIDSAREMVYNELSDILPVVGRDFVLDITIDDGRLRVRYTAHTAIGGVIGGCVMDELKHRIKNATNKQK